MFIGHYGPAIWDAQRGSGLRLWHALLAVQAIDIVSAIFSLIGIEGHNRPDGSHPLALDIAWSHSLLSAVIISVGVAIIYRVCRPNAGWRVIVLIGVLAFSHWPFDWLVHRPDLPIYPGGEQLLGLGLWDYPWSTLFLEVVLFWGMILWWLLRTEGALWTSLVTISVCIILTGLHFVAVTMPTLIYEQERVVPEFADTFRLIISLVIFLGVAAIIGYVERHRSVSDLAS